MSSIISEHSARGEAWIQVVARFGAVCPMIVA
jgi:hypothetical protein